MVTLKEGDKAPAFSGLDQNGKKVAFFVIDEKGIIRKIFLRPKNKTHAEEILRLHL